MIYRCFMVVTPLGEAVFLKEAYQRALDYAATHHGFVVKMVGQSTTDSVVNVKGDNDAMQ